MLDKNTLVKVTNRDNGSVTYIIPDLGNLHKTFQSGETKEVTMEELRKLMYVPGGAAILNKYLIIDNPEAVKELLGEVEPEYSYTDSDVKKLLSEGSLDQLEDCLNFAPTGVINLVKKNAVETELNDVRKRALIQEKTGFNVNKAIEINQETDEERVEDSNKIRKAAPITANGKTSEAPVRKSVIITK